MWQSIPLAVNRNCLNVSILVFVVICSLSECVTNLEFKISIFFCKWNKVSQTWVRFILHKAHKMPFKLQFVVLFILQRDCILYTNLKWPPASFSLAFFFMIIKWNINWPKKYAKWLCVLNRRSVFFFLQKTKKKMRKIKRLFIYCYLARKLTHFLSFVFSLPFFLCINFHIFSSHYSTQCREAHYV